MKKTTIRTALFAVAAMTAVVLASCGDQAAKPTENNNQTPTTAAAAETEAVTEALVKANVPESDFGGHVFRFIISGNIENNRQKNDFAAEEETGEALNDAVFQRNVIVEDALNIKIDTFEEYDNSNSGKGKGYKLLTTCVMSGDTTYDAAMLGGYDCATLAYSNYTVDFNTIPYIDLTKEWWDQKCNEDLTVRGKLFYTTGDISTADNDATCAILFSKALVSENDLESPYELVKNGQWTIDKMAKMCSDISADLNGDGKYDDNDRYGAIIWDDTMMAIINACGTKCCTVDSDGELALTLNSDKTVSMFQKFTDTFYSKEISYAYQRVSYDITTPVNMFSNNQSLFFLQLLDFVTYLRDMNTDFGILPFPKYDEAQENYYNTIGSWHSVFLCVPTAQEDLERTGIVLESLAVGAYNYVTPAYYEKTLVGKYVRDDESADMLDIILANRVYDLGRFYQVGGYNERIMDLWRKYKADFVSMYEKYTAKAEKDLTKINDAFNEME